MEGDGGGRGLLKRLNARLKGNVDLLTAYNAVIGVVLFPVVVVGGFVGAFLAFIQLMDALSAPNVELEFTDPKFPMVAVVNPSSKVASDIEYELPRRSRSRLQPNRNVTCVPSVPPAATAKVVRKPSIPNARPRQKCAVYDCQECAVFSCH